jgi:hypothetical protein
MEVILRKSNRKDKKYVAVMENMKHHFGGAGYEDFTTHKDPDRKERYIQRHVKNEDWSKDGIHTSGFWAKHILWNKPSLKESIKDTEKRFNIKIINEL